MTVSRRARLFVSVKRLQEPLHNHHVPPHPIELGVLFIDTNLAKTQALDQPPARMILDKYAREQFPESGLLRGPQQRDHRHAPSAVATGLTGHIERSLRNSGVTLPRPVRKRGAERDHLPTLL